MSSEKTKSKKVLKNWDRGWFGHNRFLQWEESEIISRQGYVTEAVEGITSYAIKELQANRIEIRCDSRNTRSIRVAERSGFTMEGTLRNDKCDTEGSLRSTIIFSKVRGIEY